MTGSIPSQWCRLGVVLTLIACGDSTVVVPDGGDGDSGARGCSITGCTDPLASYCDPATEACVGCLTASHCTDEAEPVCVGGACDPCLTTTQCEGQLGLPLCRPDGRCVECESVADCSPENPFCTAEGTCAQCAGDEDCSDLAPVCVEGSCQSCRVASCTGPQRIRELFAAQCLSAISLEGESALGDGFQALFCSDRADLFGALSYIERAVEAGRVVVDEAAFTECRAESWFGIFQNGGPCADALRGTVPLGESCGLALECESRRCDVPDMACSGTCVAMGVLDATCTSERDCVDGLVCTASRCVAAPLDGEVCVGLCAEGLFCNAARVCEVQHPEGGACRGVGIGGDCEEDLACRGRICAPRPTADEACWPDYLSPRCADGFRCDGSTCRVPTPIGETCAVTTECELGARCVAATCTAIGAPGDECAGSEVCALGTGCQDGRCQPLPDLGEACFDAGCFRGVCRDGTCQAQPLLTPCDAGLYVFDALDPCGGNSSCSETSSGWLCLAEGGPGDACGGTEDPSCRQPDLYCGDARACVADCFVGGL